jgi:Ser/Thr protein kinase RdoA (MazF antagonist)
VSLSAGAGRALALAYGLDEGALLEGPVDRGELSEVWRLRGRDGTFAVKVPFEPVDPGELADPAGFADAAALAGITTPRVRRGVDGVLVQLVEGRQVLLLEWLDIAPLDKRLDPVAVGALVAGIHRVPFQGSGPGHRGWFTDPVGGTEWDRLVLECRREAAPFAEPFAAYRDELVGLESLLDPLPADRTCHRDLWADNVRRVGDGGLCVFDWDNCGPANQSEELAMVVFEFGLHDASRQRALHEGYRDAGGPGRVADRRAFSMLIAVCGHIGRWQVLNWLAAAPGSSARVHAEAAVEEFLGLGPHQRLDRSAVTAILDAVT